MRFQTGFALHQESREKRYREKIIPPVGYGLLEMDAAGQEFRWMAECSGDDVMKSLCLPGEDPHSYMGSRINPSWGYRQLVDAVKREEKDADNLRKSGKVGNLCCALDTPVLTDRGYVCIQDVKKNDLVWDGVEFVRHDGVVCSGVKPVMSYDGLTTTPDHKVLVDGAWVELQKVEEMAWTIEPALGKGWTRRARTTVRIMDGIIQRAFREGSSALCTSTVQLWDRARRQHWLLGNWTIDKLPIMRSSTTPRQRGEVHLYNEGRPITEATRERLVSALQQSEGSIFRQLRRTRDRVQVRVNQGSGGVREGDVAPFDIFKIGHRSREQRWPLRTGEFTTDFSQRQSKKQTNNQSCKLGGKVSSSSGVETKSILNNLFGALCGAGAFWRRYDCPGMASGGGEAQGLETTTRKTSKVYDLKNCGPRNRFAANGLIVHNSLQYRTYPKRFLATARVDYGIDMTMAEATHIHGVYPRTYKGVPAYWSRQIQIVKNCGYVETLAGRRVTVKGNWAGSFGWAMGSTSINYRIQGTGADQKYLALACLKDFMRGLGAIFAWDLHDGIYWYVPWENLTKAARGAKAILDNLPFTEAWDYTPSIPLPWDIKVGASWGGLHAWEEK